MTLETVNLKPIEGQRGCFTFDGIERCKGIVYNEIRGFKGWYYDIIAEAHLVNREKIVVNSIEFDCDYYVACVLLDDKLCCAECI